MMDEGGVARNLVRVRRAYITAPSIYTDELQTLYAEKTPSAPRRQTCIYPILCRPMHHPSENVQCQSSSIHPALPAGYAKNGALVSGIVHSATARRLLLLLLMHDHCKA